MNKIILALFISGAQSVKLQFKEQSLAQHACDYIDNDGESIDTSLAV